MLFALLLSLAAPSAAPALFLQDPAPQEEPDLRWDGETEDAYRRALHLWQVRGKPGEAADILLGIADSQEVTQVAGQASWVLVLAARALAEAGRTDESAALIPGIERGARGSRLEAHVAAELAQLRQSPGVAQQSLDPAFFDSLVKLLNTRYVEGDKATSPNLIFSQIKKYDRPVLPYLLAIVKGWPNNLIEAHAASAAIEHGLRLADAAFVNGLLEHLESLSTLSFLNLVVPSNSQPSDDLAERETMRFWRTLAVSRDEARRKLARSVLRYHAFSGASGSAVEAVRELLLDGDPLDDADLLGMPGEANDPEDARAVLLLQVADGTVQEIAEMARNFLVQPMRLEQLRRWAVAGGRRDAVRYLACVAFNSLKNSALNSNVGTHSALERIVRQEGLPRLNWRDGSSIGESLAESQPRDFEFVMPHLLDGRMRTLLALVAIGLRDEAALRLAYSGGLPDDEPSICWTMSKQEYVPAMLLPRIQAQLRDSVIGPTAWQILQRNAPETLTLEVLLTAHESVRKQQLLSFSQILLQHGRADEALQLIDADWLEAGVRSMLFNNYLGAAGTWWDAIPVLQRRLPEFSASDRRSILQLFCNKLGGLFETDPVHLNCEAVVSLLRSAQQHGVWLHLTPAIERQWDTIGQELVEAIEQDPALTAAFLDHDGATWDAPRLTLHRLRAGAGLASFPHLGTQGRWLKTGSPESVEAARILLGRKDRNAALVAFQLLSQALDSAPAAWKEAEFCWADPVLAASAAWSMTQASDRDALVSRMLTAWELPGLEDRSLMIRAMAATADPRVAPVLLGAIADADAQVAAAAREGLERLKEIEEQRAFWESWQATGVGGSPTAALLRQIQSKNKEVRLSAIRALGAVQAPEALPLLISLLEDPDPEVVAAARAGLAWLKSEPPPK